MHRRHEDVNGRSHLQVVAPKVSRSDILHHLHDGIAGGHLGEAKTLSRLRERFYWPGHASDVRMWCKTCSHCAARKNPTHTRRAPLQSMLAGYPMQIVAVDIVGPFPSGESGNTYVLVASVYVVCVYLCMSCVYLCVPVPVHVCCCVCICVCACVCLCIS